MGRSVALPPPPSANRLYRNNRGILHRSADYIKWLELVTPIIQLNLPSVIGPARVTVTLKGGKGVMATADLDNFIKPVMDALKPQSRHKETGQVTKPGAGVIADDSLGYVTEIILAYEPYTGRPKGKPAAEIIVTLEETQ